MSRYTFIGDILPDADVVKQLTNCLANINDKTQPVIFLGDNRLTDLTNTELSLLSKLVPYNSYALIGNKDNPEKFINNCVKLGLTPVVKPKIIMDNRSPNQITMLLIPGCFKQSVWDSDVTYNNEEVSALTIPYFKADIWDYIWYQIKPIPKHARNNSTITGLTFSPTSNAYTMPDLIVSHQAPSIALPKHKNAEGSALLSKILYAFTPKTWVFGHHKINSGKIITHDVVKSQNNLKNIKCSDPQFTQTVLSILSLKQTHMSYWFLSTATTPYIKAGSPTDFLKNPKTLCLGVGDLGNDSNALGLRLRGVKRE